MRILFTGASSFTGFWFVKTLAAAGHEIVCPVTGEIHRYTGVREQRVEKLKAHCHLVPNAPFGSDHFLSFVRGQNFDLLCHHAADVTNYKSADFNACVALQNNTLNLRAGLQAMKTRGLKSVVLTGSVFENDEGAGNEPMRAFSPYGLSKGLTYQFFRFYCQEAAVPLAKFVIPNPFGPFEEPRFTAFLVKNWKAGQPAEVKTPDYLRDNIHVDLLALAYADFCGKAAATDQPLLKSNPSGYVEKQGEFAQRVARELRLRTNWSCEVKLARQTDFAEPLNRVNTEPAANFFSNWSEKKAWDAFAEFYTT